ncbi:putative JmjC domain protein [Aspergillus undulatus]|uniref:putative JmjC domain protein n=1 Tax=Aspergillus undulatus TaxID=1810928 RepID=UPI003CCDB486
MKRQQWFMCSNPLIQSQWLSAILRSSHARRFTSSANSSYKPLEVLKDININSFREGFYIPECPVLLPRQSFRDLPAYERWFHHSATKPNTALLNTGYLAAHGADAPVPLELTQSDARLPVKRELEGELDLSFRKFHAPLSLFLQWIREAESRPQGQAQGQPRLYLAQCQLLDLPQVLRDDFPIPIIVAQAGKGDIYDTNVWIGYPPTYTPLHRDPNPNLFVQLAGRKTVRLLAPQDGQVVFSHVRCQLGRSGSREAAAFRGEEMMQGRERALLEQAVWDNAEKQGLGRPVDGFEAELQAGDGLFIPKGWWHSIKGVGEGVTASVNWWFR